MKFSELINVAMSYIVAVALANLAVGLLSEKKPVIALVVGAIIATEVAAWFYGRKNTKPAPPRIKLELGSLLAGLCIAESLIFQVLWKWMPYPAIEVAIAAAGSFLFPMVIFDRLHRSIARPRKKP